MAKKEIKTNAMRQLDKAGIAYEAVEYDLGDEEFSGEAVCRLTGIPAERSFKTLCASGSSGVCVFVVPVDSVLDLKKAAAAAGEKRVELLHVKDLVRLTGYERGGVSPVGMKKQYPTFFEETAQLYDIIGISAGIKGCTILVAPDAVTAFVSASYAPLV